MYTELRCPTCGRGYPTRWRLRRHIGKHISDPSIAFALASTVVRDAGPVSFRCLRCAREFGTVRGLSIHTRLVRHGEPTIVAPLLAD